MTAVVGVGESCFSYASPDRIVYFSKTRGYLSLTTGLYCTTFSTKSPWNITLVIRCFRKNFRWCLVSRGISSSGRAPASHAGGTGIDTRILQVTLFTLSKVYWWMEFFLFFCPWIWCFKRWRAGFQGHTETIQGQRHIILGSSSK